jgi:hypothetical protein
LGWLEGRPLPLYL